MVELKIVNVVATARVCDKLNLADVLLKIKNAHKGKNGFSGIIYKRGKASVIVFKSGKVACTGALTTRGAKMAINYLISDLKNIGVKINDDINFNISNVVMSGELKSRINLYKLLLALGHDRIEYDPEQFPAAVYKVRDPKSVILIFSNGKLVATGSPSAKILQSNVDMLNDELNELGMVGP